MRVLGSFQSSMARQVNEGVKIKRSKADTLMNSKSEFHQHPVVRVVPMRGLQQEQGEEQQRGRGARRQGQWEHSTRPYFLLYFDTFHFHFLSLCLFSAFKSVLAWQRAEWDPKLLPQPPPNYFNNKLVCRPCPKRTEGDTQKYKDLHQSWLENHSSKRSSLKTTKHDLNLIQYDMQYIPCNGALLAQETLFLTQKGTPKSA